MTTIIIRKDHEGIYRGFYCMGHAGYAKKRLFGTEPDILCAAISVLVQSTIGSLSQLAGEELKVLQDKSVFLMDSMVFSLQNLSRQYGEQYLQVKIEEV